MPTLPRLGFSLLAAAITLFPRASHGDEPPKRWEQLFFPFPIVGAPPQLEQQVQLFASVFTGRKGVGIVPAAELGIIATAHLGFVASIPFQFGLAGQPTGLQDTSLLAQYLVAGSLALDNMLSMGTAVTIPTAMNNLGGDDLFFGPFVYGAQRLWRHLIFELNVTGLVPVLHGSSARQIIANALVSVLMTPERFRFPLYAQIETDSTTYLDGTTALPPLATSAPVEVLTLAPELFAGPFRSPISEGTRLAAGVLVNLTGNPVESVTYTLTVSFDVPNRYGY